MFVAWAAGPAAAQPQDSGSDESSARASGHPTAGRFTFAARAGWTSRLGSTASVDPLRVFPVEDDPFAAAGPITPMDFEAALRKDTQSIPDTNPLGLRLGARGGYTFDNDLLYVGGAFHYYLGDEELATLDQIGDTPGPFNSSTRVNVLIGGVELGVDADLGASMVMRPFVGFGVAVGLSDVCVDSECASGSQLQAYLNPGLGLFGFVTDDVFIGGELGLFGMSGPGRLSGFDAVISGGVAL